MNDKLADLRRGLAALARREIEVLPGQYGSYVSQRQMLDVFDAWQAALEAKPESVAAVPDGWQLVPIEPTTDMLFDMAASKALDDEGAYPAMFDLLDFSGENKMFPVLRAAYKAALLIAPERPKQQQSSLIEQ